MWNIEKVVSKGDYLYAIVRDHPNRTKNNYVLLHRVVMENHLGRLLDKTEIVHHKDGNKKNNDVSNLEVMTASEHASHHGRMVGRKYAIVICPNCNKVFERDNRNVGKSKLMFCSRHCNGQFYTTRKVHDAVSANILTIYRKYMEDNAEETHLQEDP